MNKLLKILTALLFTVLHICTVIFIWYLISKLFGIDFRKYLLILVIGVWAANLFDHYYTR